MSNQHPPRDDDPSDMTDFEKNTTQGELEQLEQFQTPDAVGRADKAAERRRQDSGNRGPDEQPGFGQGA